MRIIRLDVTNNEYIGDIKEEQIISAKLYEEINGEHSLTLVTTQGLSKNERLIFEFHGKWHEYTIVGAEVEHTSGTVAIGTYYCVWSMQTDLSSFLVSLMPGVGSRVTASSALTSLLSTQTRWNVGSVDVATSAGASMYDRSAWDALATLIENWGGEVSDTIVVDESGVTDRLVNLNEHIGSDSPKHRFDFGFDTISVKRTSDDRLYYNRISPRGKGEAAEGGGYGRKVTIASVNSGKDYIEDVFYDSKNIRIKNPDGSIIYPTLKIENGKCVYAAQLKTWAANVSKDYFKWNVTYTVEVRRENMGDGGTFAELQLGDNVHVYDSVIFSYPLTLRILAVEWDLLNDAKSRLQIGSTKKSIASKFANLGGSGGMNGTSYSNPSVSSAIGGVEPVSTSGINTPTGENTNICSLSLPAGVWMLCGQVAFPVNATGRRAAKISTTSGDTASVISTVVQDAVSGALTRCSTSRCLSFAAQTTVYLIGYQTSGETLSCSGQFEATRIA